MLTNHRKSLVVMVVVIIFIMACQGIPGREEATVIPTDTNIIIQPTIGTTQENQVGSAGEQKGDYKTDFPLPDDVQNFTEIGPGDSAINFQSKMSLTDAVEFYRGAFTSKGLSEDKLLTVVDEQGFSMVFRGSSNGKAVVVQGVDLGNGIVNINIRYEEV